MSIAIIIVEIILLTKSDFFQKLSPTTQSTNLRQNNSLLVNFDRKILAIRIKSDENKQGYIEPTVYNLEISNDFYILDEKGQVLNQTNISKGIHICNLSDFKENPHFFEKFGVNSYCLDENENNFIIQGFWNEKNLSFINNRLNLCSNSILKNDDSQIQAEQNDDFILTCKSSSDMKKLLNGKTMNIYYYDTVINAFDYENPFKTLVV